MSNPDLLCCLFVQIHVIKENVLMMLIGIAQRQCNKSPAGRCNSSYHRTYWYRRKVMHQHFNIQQLYALPILYLCVLYLFENKQRLVPLTA